MKDRPERSGILNVDKPSGMTSHDVVSAVRRMARQRRVGHAGTLDPLATGVLLVCVGRATRVSEYLMRSPKTYRATVRLGVETTTHDAEGDVVRELPVSATRGQVASALEGFRGTIEQIPPRYSAIKRDGVRMYELARRGVDVEVPAREVEIHGIELVEWCPPVVLLEVRCGPGTYIRALARDLGRALGCGAHLAALRRIASGTFDAGAAVDLDTLEKLFAAGRIEGVLHPLDAAFADLPALQLDGESARSLAMGQQVRIAGSEGADAEARAYAPGGRFVALVSWDARQGAWRPRKVFLQPDEISALL